MKEFSDKELLPEWYEVKRMPYYKGDGMLNVTELEQLAKDFSEYAHQQALIKNELLKKLK